MVKKIVTLMLICVLTASVSLVYAANSNGVDASLVISKEILKDADKGTCSRDLSNADKLVAQSDTLQLYFDEAALTVKVVDRRNGYVWSSALDTSEVEELTGEWKKLSQALVAAEYVDKYTPTTLVRAYPSLHNITYTPDGFLATLHFDKLLISLDLSVVLDENGITAEILDDSIHSLAETDADEKYSLSKLYIMPFLGAVESGEANGYLFIPDGCGALIRFEAGKKYALAYSERIYGTDYGLADIVTTSKSDIPAVPNQMIHMPVFGINHGFEENAFAAIIENGAEYCDIEGYPAGVMVNYFWSAAKFNYLESYFQSTGSGLGFTLLPKERNTVNARISYRFLQGEEAGYVGMANTYKQYLINNGDLVNKITDSDNIPLYIEAFMAERQRGLFTNTTKRMSSIKDVASWVTELGAEGIDNLVVSLKGFQKKGLSGSKIDSFKLDRKVGNERDLKDLYTTLAQNNGELLLTADYSRAYKHQTAVKNLVYNIDKSLSATETSTYLYTDRMFISSAVTRSMLTRLAPATYKNSLTLESTGFTAISDYRTNRMITRSEAITDIKDALSAASQSLATLALKSPNAYAFLYADYAVHVPDRHSQYIYETDAVPFLQIVLSGYVECFSNNLNFGTQSTDDILKLIDYNMYPSYLITSLQSSEFEGTNIIDIYFSEYKSLKPHILQNYRLANDILSQVRGKAIMKRNVVTDGVSVVTYDDGAQVVVNYTAQAVHHMGTDVPAKSAAVVRR